MKRSPFDVFGEILEEVIKEVNNEVAKNKTNYLPATNSKESKDNFHIELDIPGVKKEDIKVSVKDGVLTVSGERKFETKEETEKYIRVESYQGSFKRSFNIKELGLDMEKISTKLENGVLYIDLGKKEKDEGEIQVEVK